MTTWRSEAAAGRRFPVGAELVGRRRALPRLGAARASVAVVVEDGAGDPLARRAGRLLLRARRRRAGRACAIAFELDGEQALYPDPASRFQPEGPHGPSEVVDPARLPLDGRRLARRPSSHGQVLYETARRHLHARGHLGRGGREAAALSRTLGITVVEMMPVAEFPGRFGWGYDGVDLFAPTRLYGTPDDLRALRRRGARRSASG